MKTKSLRYYLDQLKTDKFNFSKYMDSLRKVKLSKLELEAIKLPKRFSPVEMASKIRVPLKSNVLDQIDLSITPYLSDPISFIGDTSISFIFIIAPTQSGKTVYLQTVVADTIEQNPGTLLYILPDENNGRTAIKEKLIGMITETPFLRKHIVNRKSLTDKCITLDNMTIYAGWSGSIGTLSSKPGKVIILDEVRLMKLSIGRESNAIKLAEDRLKTFKKFGQAQAHAVSTPAVKGDLLYNQMGVPGTITLFWMFKCQDCGRYYRPSFWKMRDTSVISKGNNTAILKCPLCNKIQVEGDLKKLLNKNGAYGIPKIHTGESTIPSVKELRKGYDRLVFRYDSMASPFTSLQDILNEYHRTKGKVEDFKNFIQCWLANFWEDDISETSQEKLESRVKKGMLKGNVPLDTKFLTGGVDSQDTGFYVTIWAWTETGAHMVDSYFVECHKDTTTVDKTKEILGNRIDKRAWKDVNNKKWLLAAWGIDIADGDRTREIRSATEDMERCYNIRGASKKQVTNVEYKEKLNYYSIHKEPYLEETELICKQEKYTLYDTPDQDFFTQFPNTRKVKERNSRTGQDTIVWKKASQDDYRLACVYAFEMLDIMFNNSYTFRDMLNDEGFEYNPAIKMSVDESTYSEPEQENEWYDNSDIDSGWMDEVL